MNRQNATFVALAAALFACPLFAQDAADEISSAPATSAAAAQTPGPDPAQTRRALIVCGLPGDSEHRKLFADTIETLYAALTARHRFAADRIGVLFSDETTGDDGPALKASRGQATRELLATTVAELEKTLQPEEALWVFVFGHAHFDGRLSWLNLPGPDIDHAEFGKLFSDVKCREQAFFITTPASGYLIKSLSTPDRIVIAATEADFEVNETIFPHKLIKLLADPPALADFDLDGDRRATLLDLYLLAARDTAQEYASGELLATEHSLLDDNGDGRGTELQLDYLTEDLGGRIRPGRAKPTPREGDGAIARRLSLPVPLQAPAPAETPSQEALPESEGGKAPAAGAE